MKASKMYIMGFIYMAVILGLVTSCGGNKVEGQGLSAGTPTNNTNSNTGLEGSGNYTATSLLQIRELIRQGSFARSNFRFGDREEYVHKIGTCGTVYNDFLWIDDIPSTQCTQTSQALIREYTNGQVTGHPLGTTKTQIISGLLALMDSGSAYLVNNNSQIIMNGGSSSRVRITVNEGGNETVYFYDLRRPLAANPASAYTQSASGDDIIQLIEYAYPQ